MKLVTHINRSINTLSHSVNVFFLHCLARVSFTAFLVEIALSTQNFFRQNEFDFTRGALEQELISRAAPEKTGFVA